MRQSKLYPIVLEVAKLSKDPSTKVGCIIVDDRGAIRATGFNGFPRGVKDSVDRYSQRNIKLQFVAHAEANAIANAAAIGTPLHNCTLLCTKFPCQECAKLIIGAGILSVVAPRPTDKWIESSQVALTMFTEAGVVVTYEDELDNAVESN